jgi:hypothetical protein
MGEAKLRTNGAYGGTSSLIDMTVSDRAIRRAKRQYVSDLSERLLIPMMHDTAMPPEVLSARAWLLAELHYDEMMRRQALTEEQQVTMTERMAADRFVAEQKP